MSIIYWVLFFVNTVNLYYLFCYKKPLNLHCQRDKWYCSKTYSEYFKVVFFWSRYSLKLDLNSGMRTLKKGHRVLKEINILVGLQSQDGEASQMKHWKSKNTYADYTPSGFVMHFYVPKYLFSSEKFTVKKRVVHLLFTSCSIYSSAGSNRKNTWYAQIWELKLYGLATSTHLTFLKILCTLQLFPF